MQKEIFHGLIEARVAKNRNRRFKAKNIQNNMVLYKCSKEIKIDKLSRTLAAILSCREAQWDVLQHEKLKTRLEAKLNKSKKSEDYTKKLLQNCKSWRGPCTSLEELQQILKEKSDQNVQIVKTELAYYAHAHKADKIANPDSCTVADLPTNEDVIATLEDRPCQHQISEPTPLNLNELCAVIWQNCDASYEWYIGYVKSIINNGYIVDHLHRVVPGCHIKWKYPSTEDVQTAELEQIVNCTVKGEWDITPDTRKRFFIIENIKAIKAAFHKLGEHWAENKEPVKDGITFYLKYLGSVLLDDPNSRTATAAAIKKIITMAKSSSKKLNRISLNVSPSGIKVIDQSSSDIHLDISIYRISYCSADANHDHVVAFISTDKNETLECHAFLCPKRKVAQAVAVTIAQSFNLAFETWQYAKERDRLNKEKQIKQENSDGSTSRNNGIVNNGLSKVQQLHQNSSNLLIDLDDYNESPGKFVKQLGFEGNTALDESFTKLANRGSDPFLCTEIRKEEEREIVEYVISSQQQSSKNAFDIDNESSTCDDSTDFLLVL
ncbi:Low density lipoprotein receptor adapter protein 1-B [Nymphon striatum]|nr:Low density lipoprotein receptor adapter protein 1-B [Nymphon striatum]